MQQPRSGRQRVEVALSLRVGAERLEHVRGGLELLGESRLEMAEIRVERGAGLIEVGEPLVDVATDALHFGLRLEVVLAADLLLVFGAERDVLVDPGENGVVVFGAQRAEVVGHERVAEKFAVEVLVLVAGEDVGQVGQTRVTGRHGEDGEDLGIDEQLEDLIGQVHLGQVHSVGGPE